jgi:serine protease Do
MNSRFANRFAAVALAVGLVSAGFMLEAFAATDSAPASAAPAPSPAAAPERAEAPAPRGAPDFASIVRRSGPAVVNVTVTGTVKAAGFGGDADDEELAPFLHRFGIPSPHGNGEALTRGVGSGFIVQDDGVILTNAHVVDGAREVTVKLTDKRAFRARVVGVDKDTDVAVLKIDAKGLPTVRIGDPGRVQVGDWVLAIGSPFGFENSATAGVVSARARSLPGQGYVPFLQTDVAVNPGNSGGPLFDLSGAVIGVNSQIFSGSGGYMGISFAIPIDVAMKVASQLETHGKVVRGRLGVVVQDVSQELADAFRLPRPEGALVSSVVPGGAAAKAGLRAGDVILSLDGAAVSGSGDLPPRVADLPPGRTARLEVWRDGARRALEVKVEAAPEEREATAHASSGAPAEKGRLGLAVRPLTPEERRQAGVVGGAVVEDEDAAGPAARAGIQPGDVVLAVNGAPVSDVESLRGLVAKAKGRLALLVQRGDSRLFVPVDLG